MQNIEISAVSSLADICFLHVLYLAVLLCWTIRCFTYAIRVNCVSHIELLSVSNLPSGLLTLHATPLFFYFYAVDFIFMQLCVPLFSVWRFWSFELDIHQTRGHFKE